MASFVPQTRSQVEEAGFESRFPDAPARLSIPDRFGPYRRIKLLGEGGMGEVHLAEDSHRGQLAALKFSRYGRNGQNNPEGLQRFRREALASANFDHPGLCPVYDAGLVDGFSYLAMAYVEGEPLSTQIRDCANPFDQGSAARLMLKVALAIAEAHARGIIHRDLKPSNIILRPDGEPVVIDFGLAWWSVPDESRLTKSGTVLGTPHYMSPEQVNGDVRLMGPGCDIYSLGVVLYELLTGRRPFDGSLASVLGKILFFEPPRPRPTGRTSTLAWRRSASVRWRRKSSTDTRPCSRWPRLWARSNALHPRPGSLRSRPLPVKVSGRPPPSGRAWWPARGPV